jgi:hypothetical protein
MKIVKPSTENDYLLSFFIREHNKRRCEIPPPEKRRETLLKKWPSKFPFEGEKELTWHICRISTVEELEQLWMHKHGDWLEKHDLWRGSHWLGDLAKTTLEMGLFKNKNYQDTGQYKNYYRWRDTELKGQLDGHERPLLVEEGNHIDICDGFGRLLPYLALIYEGKQFFPFHAYLARSWTASVSG